MNDLVPRPIDVVDITQETQDVWTLTLDDPAGLRGGGFRSGQFNMIYVFASGEVPISMSGDPGRPERVRHTVRAVGDTTRGLCAVRVGEQVGVRGPFGQPWPVDVARGHDLCLIAGGIGLAPLRPVLYEVAASRAQFGRVRVLYGARTPADLLFTEELDRWRDTEEIEVETIVDRAGTGWSGRVGVVPELVDRARGSWADTVVFMCGPEVMMRFVVRALERREVRSHQIYLSLERHMKCGLGRCGRCQYGADFVCRDGPVFSFDRVQDRLAVGEI